LVRIRIDVPQQEIGWPEARRRRVDEVRFSSRLEPTSQREVYDQRDTYRMVMQQPPAADPTTLVGAQHRQAYRDPFTVHRVIVRQPHRCRH
jgi:hypothetical protein